MGVEICLEDVDHSKATLPIFMEALRRKCSNLFVR